tara:strand:+ start:333 stop:632 length:300 start_codon:yes stop_codon:yes gene_type:complete
MTEFKQNFKGVVTFVHINGFAFARDVFIPPNVHKALGEPQKGSQIIVQVIPSTNPKSKYTALMPAPQSKINWGPWQTLNDQILIPDTRAGSDHHSIDFS